MAILVHSLFVLCRHNEELIEKLSVPKKDAQPLHFDSEYPQGYISQFNQCLWKFWLSYWRDAPCESGKPPASTRLTDPGFQLSARS